jgi:hypothetical protein
MEQSVPEWALVLGGMAILVALIVIFKKGKRDGSGFFKSRDKQPPTKTK